MTTATSAALLAMREAEERLDRARRLAPQPGRMYFALLEIESTRDALRAAIAHEEARLDSRVEVVAAALAPAAFNVTESGYSPEQAAEERRHALADARAVLDALDAYTHARNEAELDALIGRGSTS